MLDQIFENVRKLSETSMQMQQDFLSQWTKQWNPGQANAAGSQPAREWPAQVQKRWFELAIGALERHREALDSAYRTAIQTLQESFRLSEARSPDEYMKAAEELWRKTFDLMRSHSETQLREFQKLAERSFSVAQSTPA